MLLPRRAPAALFLLVCALLSTSLATPVGADTAGQLKAAKERLASLESQISSETATLSDLQAQATAVTISIGHVEQRIAQTRAEMAQVRQQMAAAIAHQRSVQGQLDDRARAAFEQGPGAPLEFLLGSVSLADLTDRLQILNSAAQSDAALVAEIERYRAQLASQRAQLTALESELQARNQILQREQSQLTAEVQAAQQTLNQLSSGRLAAGKLVSHLKTKLERERAAAAAAGSLSGLPPGVSSGPATYRPWAADFLAYERVSTCTQNQILVVAWELQEGTAARYNPLDTTLLLPGSTNYNSVGVQNYGSWSQGLQATALSLSLGATVFGYGRIVADLAACAPALTTAQAIATSNWCGICWPTYVVAFLPQAEAMFGQ